jgi:hypothetical protein
MVRTIEKKGKSVESRDTRKGGGKVKRTEEATPPKRNAKKFVKADEKPIKSTKPDKGEKQKTKPKAETKKAARDVEKGYEREKDMPWCDKKVRLFKTLKQLDALSPKTAVLGRDIINRSNERLNAKDVRHYSYHAGALKDHEGKPRKEALISIANPNDVGGYLFYLTKSGAKLDPNEEFKKQEAAKPKE